MMRCKVCGDLWYAVVTLDRPDHDQDVPLCRQHTAQWTTNSDWTVVRTAQAGLDRF